MSELENIDLNAEEVEFDDGEEVGVDETAKEAETSSLSSDSTSTVSKSMFHTFDVSDRK